MGSARQSENLDQDLITPDHPDYWRQIRRNTQYIIHPEEIIADNFSMMLTNAKVTNTDLVEAIREQFQEVGELLLQRTHNKLIYRRTLAHFAPLRFLL